MKRILILSLLLMSASAQAALDWKPARTFVFVVGLLEWADSETFEPFPKENRRDLQLVNFFRKDPTEAHHLMLKVHMHGKAIVAVYTRDIAETKVQQVEDFAREQGHPLMITLEPDE